MNIKTSLTGQKLAILIGSQSRAIKDTYMNINFFLSLFDIPYDVFICSDEADLDNFKLAFPFLLTVKELLYVSSPNFKPILFLPTTNSS